MAFYWPIYRRRRAALLLMRYFLEESEARRLLPTFVMQEDQIGRVQLLWPSLDRARICGLIRQKEQQQQLASFKELIGKSLPG